MLNRPYSTGMQEKSKQYIRGTQVGYAVLRSFSRLSSKQWRGHAMAKKKKINAVEIKPPAHSAAKIFKRFILSCISEIFSLNRKRKYCLEVTYDF